MKRILVFVALIGTLTVASAQKSIDYLFDKYSGKEGFVTVTLSGNLLKLASVCDDNDDNDDDRSLPANITEIRVLAQNNEEMRVENFYELAMRSIKVGDYEEFMSVKKTNQDVKMYVRAEGNRFREFLLIAGGDDNAIIQIKGDMTFKEAKKFSEDAKKNHGVNIVAEHR